jgi:hypothetical protein
MLEHGPSWDNPLSPNSDQIISTETESVKRFQGAGLKGDNLMSVKKIITKTRTGFTSLPNKFIQDKSISVEAKGTAAFLQSLPHGWQIHPNWVKEQLGYKRKVWARVANELIEYGCLERYVGGKDGGTYYTFDLWNYQENFLKPEMHFSANSPKSDSRQKCTLIKKHKQNKKTETYVKTNKEPKMNFQVNDDVVVFWLKELEKKNIDMGEKVFIKLFTQYGPNRIKEKLDMIDDANPRNREGWFHTAVLNDWKPTAKPVKAKTQARYDRSKDEALSRVEEDCKLAKRPEATKARNNEMKHIKDILPNVSKL